MEVGRREGWEGQGVGPARGLKAYVPAGWGGRPAGQVRSWRGGRRLAIPHLPPHGATNDRADSTFDQEEGTAAEAAALDRDNFEGRLRFISFECPAYNDAAYMVL